MKRKWVGSILLLAAVSARAETLNVQVRQAVLRAAPSMLAAPVGQIGYAEAVQVVERRPAWVRVRAGTGLTGWLHESAVTRRQLTVQAGAETVAAGAGAREVALAGKGFSEEIEQAYRKEVSADYTWVDRMERWAMSPARLAAFLEEGGVRPQGGTR